ncbi:magnesium/cobalt transporter CorA [Reyranella sp. CPCC 100927]|uniref:magnesium/cobalt transporter CorA n=1 Tax=Reyranella sp. CPCC 100927 TaxID=2599616 RepID=UPI0011B41B66|nr:magnesium/cobalt transporter CorA [Reyranella sp. CPCC 100927]TWT09945.1 magnesium/cobalt transporter CorA [Reyranella sp. CPCC 100927]
MIRILTSGERKMVDVAAGAATLPADAVWIDLLSPTRSEVQSVEKALGLELPTHEEMLEIEPSSRLYQDGGATFATASLLWHSDSETPEMSPVTFVLGERVLVTIRYGEPKSFSMFQVLAEKQGVVCQSSATVLLGLLDAVIDRLADILERCGIEVDRISKDVFGRATPNGRIHTPTHAYTDTLQRIGRQQDIVNKARESLVGLGRVVGFLTISRQPPLDKAGREHLKTLSRDARSLTDHAAFIVTNINFLLDATLGMINIEQNQIIKIFSVAAVAFLPPTLVASIYGMNFEFMPELKWSLGYPLALALMVLSAVVPFLYFRRRKWL